MTIVTQPLRPASIKRRDTAPKQVSGLPRFSVIIIIIIIIIILVVFDCDRHFTIKKIPNLLVIIFFRVKSSFNIIIIWTVENVKIMLCNAVVIIKILIN